MNVPLFRNIIVAINGSDSSLEAAKYAILMSKTYHCKLHVIYVVDTATIKYLSLSKFFVPEESAEYEENLRSSGQRYLQYIDELAHDKGVKIQTVLKSGVVWSEIVTYADEIEADLILLGGHTDESISSGAHAAASVLSREARDVLGHARCSVMIVKKPLISRYFKMA